MKIVIRLLWSNPFHYGPEATPTKEKSTGRSESSSDTTMTSPVTKKNFKIRPLGDFEKTYVLYVAMAEKKTLLTGQKWFFGHCYVQNVRFLEIL